MQGYWQNNNGQACCKTLEGINFEPPECGFMLTQDQTLVASGGYNGWTFGNITGYTCDDLNAWAGDAQGSQFRRTLAATLLNLANGASLPPSICTILRANMAAVGCRNLRDLSTCLHNIPVFPNGGGLGTVASGMCTGSATVDCPPLPENSGLSPFWNGALLGTADGGECANV